MLPTMSVILTPAASYIVYRPNTRCQLLFLSYQHPPSATVSVVPTPTVSYNVGRPNTCRQLQCLSSQHPPSATLSLVPTPAVSYTVSRTNTRRQLQCLSYQHPPSATVSVVPTPSTMTAVPAPLSAGISVVSTLAVSYSENRTENLEKKTRVLLTGLICSRAGPLKARPKIWKKEKTPPK